MEGAAERKLSVGPEARKPFFMRSTAAWSPTILAQWPRARLS